MQERKEGRDKKCEGPQKSRKLYPTEHLKGQSYDLTDGAVSTVGCSCEEEVVITCNIILPVMTNSILAPK